MQTVCRVRVQGVYVDGVVLTEDLKKRVQHRLRVLREDKRQARKQHDAERKSYGQCESSCGLATLFFLSLFYPDAVCPGGWALEIGH